MDHMIVISWSIKILRANTEPKDLVERDEQKLDIPLKSV